MDEPNQRDGAAEKKQAILYLFAFNLNYWRKMKGLSRKVLAEKVGVSETTIFSYEQGHKAAGIDKVIAIATALDISVANLIGEGDFNPISSDFNLFFDWRITRCLKLAQMAGYYWDWNKLNSEVTITPLPEIRQDINVATGDYKPTPITMHEQTFVAVFERISDIALIFADLPRIAKEELQKL